MTTSCRTSSAPRTTSAAPAAITAWAARYQVPQRDGRRCSAAVAYLHPAAARGNVDILTDARVYRILFEGKRAVGVELMRHGRLEQVRAEREVIISAGTYHSPQLLML